MKRLLVVWVALLGCWEEGIGQVEELGGSVDQPVWWQGDGVTGYWDGFRTGLEDRGLTFYGGYTVEVWGNTTGGLKTGAVYTGLLDFGLELDLERLVGWQGGRVNTSWLWLSGRDASEDLVGNFLTISNIAGFNTLRMFELWFSQTLWEERIEVQVGQLAADSTFVISDYAGLFLNGTFGWPAFMYMNLPEGGPGYPMGTLGARLEVNPVSWMSFQTAVFQGNVFAQDVNRHGFRWRLDARDGYTFLSEAGIQWNQREEEAGLPGRLKNGIWFQTGEYADVLADSTASGNFGLYWVFDQMLFRETVAEEPLPPGKDFQSPRPTGQAGSKKTFKEPVLHLKSDEGLGWFTRLSFAKSDRNFLNFYVDAGINYKGLIPGRSEDSLGIAFAYAQLSNGARWSLAGEGISPVGAEMVLEATYQAQITPWMILQPDIQYVINPGGSSDLGNALVVGGRCGIVF